LVLQDPATGAVRPSVDPALSDLDEEMEDKSVSLENSVVK
jgi:hypothetical protein